MCTNPPKQKRNKEQFTARQQRDERRGAARRREHMIQIGNVHCICCINHRPQTSNYDMRAQYKRDSSFFFFFSLRYLTSAASKRRWYTSTPRKQSKRLDRSAACEAVAREPHTTIVDSNKRSGAKQQQQKNTSWLNEMRSWLAYQNM